MKTPLNVTIIFKKSISQFGPLQYQLPLSSLKSIHGNEKKQKPWGHLSLEVLDHVSSPRILHETSTIYFHI